MVSAIEKNEDGRKEIHLEFEVYFGSDCTLQS